MILFIILVNASVFSIEGLGEDQAIFRNFYYGDINIARIEFSLRPEFNILNKGSDFRGIFWTNPFLLNMKIPVYKGLSLSLGSIERYNQSFDIYGQRGSLGMYIQGRGGIEELYFQLNQHLHSAELFFRGSYLYGSSREIWEYTIGNYSIADTFLYKNNGRIFCGGLKLFFLSCYYEGLGTLNMDKDGSDTTYELPQVLGFGFGHNFNSLSFNLAIEHSFGGNWDRVTRAKLSVVQDRLGLSYSYNPWHYDGIKEHNLSFILKIQLSNMATISFNPYLGLRMKGSLREFFFVPEFELILEEVFARRKK